MGRATRNKQREETEPLRHKARFGNRLFTLALFLAVVALVVVSIRPDWLTGRSSPPRTTASPVQTVSPESFQPISLAQFNADYDLEPKTLNELLDVSIDEFDRVDIARMNLLCASRLPSTQDFDIEHALAKLDEWAQRVAFETDRHLYRISDPRFAEHYGHSEAQFRAEMLAQVLQEDLGVKYNMTADGNFSFADPSVGFIHGMIPGPGETVEQTAGGTCVSMPVLYVAVGRRLGYPLKLSTTDSHVFARWDGEAHPNPAWRERFNCETTNGFSRHGDEYYRSWPKPVTEQEIARHGYLKSLTPAEELALFLATRGHHAMDVGEPRFAARCYENAHNYDMRNPSYRAWFLDAVNQGGQGYQPSAQILERMLAAQEIQRFSTTRRNDFVEVDVPEPPKPDESWASLKQPFEHNVNPTDPYQPVIPR